MHRLISSVFKMNHMSQRKLNILTATRLNQISEKNLLRSQDSREGLKTRMSHFSGSLVVIESVFKSPKRRRKKIRSFNRFSVIKYNQLRANKTSCHWFIFALDILVSFLGSLDGRMKKKDRINADKDYFLRNSWNWEINRLISRRFWPFFVCCSFQMAQAFRLPFPAAWIMSDDTSMENATGFQLTELNPMEFLSW